MEISTLFTLPEEIIEKVTTYLDSVDLKFLTQTCKFMNEVSWRRLGKITEIRFWKELTNADIETFKKSSRTYENVKFTTYDSVDDVTLIENILEQVSSIPTIKLYNITLKFASGDISDEMQRALQPYAHTFKTIAFDIDVKDLSFRVKADKIRSMFPKAKIIFTPYFSPTSSLSFDEVNSALLKPKLVLFRNNFQKIIFGDKIRNVKSLNLCSGLENTLEHFKGVKDLDIDGKLDIKLLESMITNNKSSLQRLKITELEEPWLFKFPCQMKELTCWFADIEVSSSYAEILSGQRNLRHLLLHYSKLTNDLFDVMSKNKLLTTVEFSLCTPEESLDLSKYEFLNNVSDISFTDVNLQEEDMKYLNAIIDNSKKASRLLFEVDMLDEDPEEMDLETTTLENLQVLQVNGMDISKFISRRIKAPNLEICSVDCYSESLFECNRLRNLTIVVDELDYDKVVNMLEALQSLETFHFVLEKREFEKILVYILGNINNIKHFRIDLFQDPTIIVDIAEVVESTLKASGISWTKLRSIYQTEQFSFEIY